MSSSSSRGKKKVKDVQLPKTSESLAREAVDVVIPTVENNLDFLNKWRDVLCRFHIIIIQDGDQSVELQVPKGLDVEIHNRASINKILGPLASCISFKDSACRCFGFLVSQKRFIFTMDDDCLVAMDPNGELINPLKQHIENLLYPSTPLHFNPVYEPSRHGSQFTKGYPFDQRKGVTTAVSQGLCLNEPNYDAITKLVNPLDRNLRYVDAVVTIPKGTLFSMSGRNLAFDRGLIGPAMYFGLMGEGCPIGRYGDLWAGWCSKVICDHLGFGIKSGLPYIWHSRESDPFVNKKAEEKGSIDWQKDLVTFFQNVTFPTDCKTVQACYINLSQQVEDKLGKLDPYFIELAVAMKMWVEAWEMHSPPAGLMNILGAYQSNVVGLGPPA